MHSCMVSFAFFEVFVLFHEDSQKDLKKGLKVLWLAYFVN